MSGTVHRLLTSLRPARMAPLWVAAVGSLAWVAALPAAPAPPPARPMVSRPADTTTFFESRVRPVLAEKCFTCHGPRLQQGGLRLDSRQGLLKGGAQGPALAPTASERSLLLRAVRHAEPGLQMPPGEKLRDDQIADLERWVRMGAPWPVERMKAEGGRMKGAAAATSLQPDAQHWAFRPVKRPALPPVKGRNWVKTPIDAFILADLEKRNLAPAPPADRRTLLRRATFDLTGLPPTPEESEAFIRDQSPDAWAKVIDRLLASPRYGERWGRHWLDVARYADTNGLDENYHYANAWRYRDYVIDAFNRDLPFDQFIREQLAGDLLPPTGDPAVDYRRLTATGFLVLGPKLLANPDKQQVRLDIIDEQVDVTSKAFLGLTLSCARCHDHKFDPLSQKDYTALAGILHSTRTMESLKDRRWMERPLAPPEVVARATEHQKTLEARKKDLEAARKQTDTEVVRRLEAEVAELERTAPPPVPYALAVSDDKPEDLPLYIRGNPHQPGEVVPRQFPVVLTGGQPVPLTRSGSGRLELAEWLSRRDHPLTARVLMNRVWQWHFGVGLVPTADNFGKLGEAPTHPALLDWLASECIRRGWSLKGMHRLLMLSSTYRMSARGSAAAVRLDPENRLLSRMHRRRLEVEELRDALLLTSGQLDLAMGGSLLDVPNFVRVTNDDSGDLAVQTYGSTRRSIYLPVVRNSLFEFFELFDAADPSSVTARRSDTIAATQALFLMNHPLPRDCARKLAENLLTAAAPGEAARVQTAYLRVLGRPARPAETARALHFLRDYAAAAGPDVVAGHRKAWESFAHVLYCSNSFTYLD